MPFITRVRSTVLYVTEQYEVSDEFVSAHFGSQAALTYATDLDGRIDEAFLPLDFDRHLNTQSRCKYLESQDRHFTRPSFYLGQVRPDYGEIVED